MAEPLSSAGTLTLGGLDPAMGPAKDKTAAAATATISARNGTTGGDDTTNGDDTSGPSLSPMLHVLIAGGVGGAVGDSAMFPLDTVKTRQQGAPGIEKYRSTQGAFRTIVSQEGIRKGIYSGYLPALLGSFPSTMLFFGVYELTKRRMVIDYDIEETVSHLTAGFLGDLVSSVIYVPSEVLKTRMQLQGRYNNPHFHSGYNYRGMTDAARSIVRTEGWGAMFYGYRATLVRDLPFSALQLAFYEKLRSAAQRLSGQTSHDLSLGWEIATGAVAGGLAGVITTPLDVVKTRIQTQSPASEGGGAHVDNSTVRALRSIFAVEGLRGVFAGVGPRLVWTATQSSIMLLVYQSTIKYLDERSESRLAQDRTVF